MATDGIVAASRSGFTRRRMRRGLIIGVLALAVLAIEGVSAARLAATATRARLTLDQQLAAAQRAVSFPIRQPSWLPARVTLQSVWADSCPAAICGAGNSHVHLRYSSSGGISYALDEGTTPITYSFETLGTSDHKPSKMDEVISTVPINGVAGELDLYSGTLTDTPVQDAVLHWSQGGVYYGLVANAAPGFDVAPDDMQRMAESM
jgi:hypothetical protein